jgi:hypothetical protein
MSSGYMTFVSSADPPEGGFCKTSVFAKAPLDLVEKVGANPWFDRPLFQKPFVKLTEFCKRLRS